LFSLFVRHYRASRIHRQNLFAPAKLFVAQPLVNPAETFILQLGFYNFSGSSAPFLPCAAG
jgi:hypothetical protein